MSMRVEKTSDALTLPGAPASFTYETQTEFDLLMRMTTKKIISFVNHSADKPSYIKSVDVFIHKVISNDLILFLKENGCKAVKENFITNNRQTSYIWNINYVHGENHDSCALHITDSRAQKEILEFLLRTSTFQDGAKKEMESLLKRV